MKLPIYLDYSATTPVDPRVAQKMIPYLTEQFGNPASRSHAFGWEAEEAVEEAREHVAALVNCDPEGNRLDLGRDGVDQPRAQGRGAFLQGQGQAPRHGQDRAQGDARHDARARARRFRSHVPRRHAETACSTSARFEAALRPDTILVSVMSVNNEIGVIQDIAAIGEICRARGIIFHVDAAQATGKMPIDLAKLKVDLMSFSAHKTYGPKGIGALFVRRKPRVRIEAQMHGGGHERGMRSGTLPTHQIVGMGEAFRLAKREMATRERARSGCCATACGTACSEIEEVYVNGDMERRVPHNLNVSFNFVEGESADHGDQGHRRVVGVGLHVGLPRAVVRAARAGPQRRARAQLDPLHHRPLHDRGGDRLHGRRC